jgi:hypothetical protein
VDVPSLAAMPVPEPVVSEEPEDDLYGFADETNQPVQPIKPIVVPATGVNVADPALKKRASAGQPKSAPVIPGFAMPAHSGVKYDDSKENRRGLIIGIASLLLVGVLVGAFAMLGKSKPTVAHKGADAEILKLMDDKGAVEAKEFLDSHKSRMIMGMTRESGYSYIDRMYDRGAVKVLAFDGTMVGSLIIELPTDAEKRKVLFEYVNQWHEDMHLPPQADQGQRYLRIMMRV